MQPQIKYIQDTSTNIRHKERLVVDRINEALGDKKLIVYSRDSEGSFPTTRYTVGLGRFNLPEFVITGSGITVELYSYYLSFCVEQLENISSIERDIMTGDDYVNYLNNKIEEAGLSSNMKLVLINTEQFMWGVGLNCKRFYGRVYSSVKVIQLIHSDKYNHFPREFDPLQLLLPTEPFGSRKARNNIYTFFFH